MEKNRTDEIRFVQKQLTPLNPKDIYYKNMEELKRSYYFLLLVGMLLISYIIFY